MSLTIPLLQWSGKPLVGIWRSDGTTQGTGLLKDIKSNGSSDSHPQGFAIHKKDRTLYSANNDDLYFYTEYGRVWKVAGDSGLIEEIEVDDSWWEGAGKITSVDIDNGATDLYFTSGLSLYKLSSQPTAQPQPQPDCADSTDVFRLYNAGTGVHFFTPSPVEKDDIISKPEWGYKYEGVAYKAPTDIGTELYRFFNRDKGYHFLTASKAEADSLTGKPEWGYKYEGRSYKVTQQATSETPNEVRRFYNPGKGIHFYSASDAEANNIIANSLGSGRIFSSKCHRSSIVENNSVIG